MDSSKESEKQIYKINHHRIISQIIALLTFCGLWEKKNDFLIVKWLKKLYYLLMCSSMCVALLWGSYLSDNNNESFFLTAGAVAVFLHIVKLISVLRNQDQISTFLDDICVHSLSDLEQYNEIQDRLNNFAKFGYVNVWTTVISVVGFNFVILPIFSTEVALPLSIGFPLDWRHSRLNYWLAHSFISISISTITIVYVFTMVYWYIMLNCSIKYKILGQHFRTLGQRTVTVICENDKIPMVQMRKLISQFFVELVETHQNIKKSINDVKSCFTQLFLTQITTSSICICCSVYVMAFTSQDSPDFVKRFVLNFIILFVNGFDLFVVLYLGNEITTASADLMYCVFESDWIGQPEAVVKDFVILTEILKKPQRLIILKLYPMNLETFTSIAKLTYSMFNILKSFGN